MFHFSTLVSLVAFVWVLLRCSTEGLPIEEQLQQLIEHNNAKIMGLLAARDARIEQLESKVTRLVELELKLEELKSENQEQQALIVALQQQINQRTNTIRSKSAASDGWTPVVASGMPKSCADLYAVGHTSGIHLVMGTKKIESVYCDFNKLPTDSDFETKIGQADVKSSPVYFYVQKNTYFNTTNVAIPFQVARLNVGGAMNIATGIFTAPRPGVYFFSFSGIGSPMYTSYPELYLNSNAIGRGKSHTNFYTNTIQSTLQLVAGDKVSLKLNSGGTGYLYDDAYHYTHFTGWILQEDL